MPKKKTNKEIVALADAHIKTLKLGDINPNYIKSNLIKVLIQQDEATKRNVSNSISKLPTRIEEDEWIDDHAYVRLDEVLEAIKKV